jgi:hypothetical protein
VQPFLLLELSSETQPDDASGASAAKNIGAASADWRYPLAQSARTSKPSRGTPSAT